MSSHHIRVLVADDEPSLRKVVCTSLSTSGFAAEEVRNGEEALAAIQQRPFDLLLLDINMPGMGGIETCRQIRNLGLPLGIVMLTVRNLENDKVKALEA